LSLILPHVNYGNIVFTGADFAWERWLGVAFKACLRYIHMRRRLDHVSHLESTVTGTNSAFVVFFTRYCILYRRRKYILLGVKKANVSLQSSKKELYAQNQYGRVIYPSIGNFILIMKIYAFRGQKSENICLKGKNKFRAHSWNLASGHVLNKL
jgi:hypothetical protein